MSTVLVNGTGTIGEPLIALLLSMKKKLEFDNLIFYKHTPRLIDRPMLNNLIAKGGKLCVEEAKFDEFKKMGVEPSYTWEEALEKADVVADATKENVGMRNKEEFYKTHADFCSRLGMTFSHGDYSSIDAIEEKEKVAEKLFRKALSYFPDHRAYLGLGVLKQNEGKIEGAVQILSEGVKHFPESEQLNVCLGINYTNLGQYKQALEVLLKFQHSQEGSYSIARCYKALGNRNKEAGFLQKQIQAPEVDG